MARLNRMSLSAVLAACGLVLLLQATPAQPAPAGNPSRLALLSKIEGAIGPATPRQVSAVLAEARRRHAGAVILELDTPGGLLDSTHRIIAAILASDIPVIGYVAPPGAHAASAGTYILYATGLAAMAPGTNLGAATPIRLGSEEKEGAKQSTLETKIINDAVAQIRALAEMHGRNADWAEKAVRQATALSAEQAKAKNVIELIATNVPDLLAKADGMTVLTAAGKRVLHSANMVVEPVEPGFMTELLTVIGNPNVAFILMLIGVVGLIFEFANPGQIAPGIVGTIALLLGLYALNQLPLNYAGLGLLLFGLALMVAEAVTPAFGVLGLGGIGAFIFGAAILIDSDQPEFQLSWWVIAAAAAFSGLLLVLLLGYVWRSQRRPVTTGREALHGAPARVLSWDDHGGAVLAQGERWQARGPAGLKPGDMVRVAAIEGLTLVVDIVQPAGGDA